MKPPSGRDDPDRIARQDYQLAKESVLAAAHEDERSILKYLVYANAGLAVSLATWLQHCFSSDASGEQRAMITPLLHGLSASAIGLGLAVLIPIVGGYADVSTSGLIEVHEFLRRMRRRVARPRDLPPPLVELRRLQEKYVESLAQRSEIISLRWIRLWHAISAVSWLAFFAGILIVLVGGYHVHSVTGHGT